MTTTRSGFVVALSVLGYAGLAQAWEPTDVMLQGFNWESHHQDWYAVLQSKAADMAADEIDIVWFPPPTDSAAAEGYLPRQLYVLDSSYGTYAQLTSAIGALHSSGVQVIADIVVNHRVGLYGWADLTNPTWGPWAITNDDEWGQGTGGPDSGSGYDAGRDLDHSNQTVANDIKAWMSWLRNTVSFDGWRYDYAKGYWGGYPRDYNHATQPAFAVGEVWPDIPHYDASHPHTDYHRQIIVDWIDATDGTAAAFDFTTKWQLQLALERNELWRMAAVPGVIGWWPQRAVTFLDNHDTGSTQNHWPFPGARVMEGYAYILTHPGIPCIFWDHFYDWGHDNAIGALIAVRKAAGIGTHSSVDVQATSGNLYAAIIDGTVAMKIGSDSWSPGAGWSLATSGNNYAVWVTGGGGNDDTTIRAHYDVGFGNTLYVRGNPAPLSWGTGLPMNWTTGNVWVWVSSELPQNQRFEFKVLVNDVSWETGENHTGSGGDVINVHPSF